MKLVKAELCHPLDYKAPEGVLGVNWCVFDDHVCIDDNVTMVNSNSFTLNARPVGEVRILLMGD